MSKLNIILIDDDSLMHMVWNKGLKDHNFTSFFSIEDFISKASDYPKDALVYIDSDLGNGVRGEIDGKKIFDLGFSNIYIATGYSADDIKKADWIKEVVGKRPPTF